MGNQELPVNAAVTSLEDLCDKFEPPLNLIATQGYIRDVNDASCSLENLYFNNFLYYIKMRNEKAPAVASFVSFSDTEINSKHKVEHILINKCVKLTKICIGDLGASSHMAMTPNGMFDLK